MRIGPRPPAHPRPVRRRARGALGTLLVLALAAGGALTGPPPAAAVDGLGLVPPPPAGWTYATGTDGATASAPLPGDAASLAPVVLSLDAGSRLRMEPRSNDNVPVALPTDASVAAASDCLAGAAVGAVRSCGQNAALTVTFRQPVVDPVLRISIGGGANASAGDAGPSQWCTRTWQQARIARVNGAEPVAGDVTRLPAPGTYSTWDPVTLEAGMPATVADGEECLAPRSDAVWVAVRGVVESVDLDLDLWSMITQRVTGAPAPSTVGGVAVVPHLPAADLAVTTSAPAVVDAGGRVTWDLTVRNLGEGSSHGYVVRDAVPAGMTGVRLVSAPAGCALDGNDLRCVSVPPGCAAAEHPAVPTWADLSCTPRRAGDVVVLAAGATAATVTLTGTAPTPRGTVLTSTATVAGVDVDPVTTNNTARARTTVEAPTLTVGKDVPERAGADDQFVVRAGGQEGVVASVETTGSGTRARSAAAQVVRGREYTITEAMAAGSPGALGRYGGRLDCRDDTGAAVPVTGTGPSWTVTPTENRAYECVVTNTALLRAFTVAKSASVAAARPGDVVTYTLDVVNTGEVPYTDADPAVLTDDLSGVLDEAVLTGTPTAGATVDGTTLRWSGALDVGERRTLTYAVTVGRPGLGDGTLVNAVRTPDGSGGSCPADDPAPACSTRTPVEVVTAPVHVEKVDDAGQRLDGSGFEVLADAGGTPGAALTDAGGAEVETGLFRFDVLAPGTYWLRETRAPTGHELLAAPVAFTVARDGTLALAGPWSDPQLTVSPDRRTLTVVDVPRFTLPHAGAGGTTPLVLAGGALLLLAGTLTAARARRSRVSQTHHHPTKENA